MRSGSIDLPGVGLHSSYPRESYSLSVTPDALLDYCEQKGINRYDILSDASVWNAGFHETLIAGLRNQRCGINCVARELAMSARTLQRALKASGTSFRKEVDRTRLQLTVERLSSGRIDDRFICGTLGFHDTRSFYRAFKRWTGSSPSGYLSKNREIEP